MKCILSVVFVISLVPDTNAQLDPFSGLGLIEVAALADTSFNDTFRQYVKEAIPILNAIKDVMEEYQKPDQVAEQAYKRKPVIAKSFGVVVAVCQVSALKKTKYVGPACQFVTANAALILLVIQGIKMNRAVMLDRCISDRDLVLALTGDKMKKSQTVLKDISCQVERHDPPATIMKTTVAQYGELLDETNMLTASCKIDTIKANSHLRPACGFVGEHTEDFKEVYGAYIKQADEWAKVIAHVGAKHSEPQL